MFISRYLQAVLEISGPKRLNNPCPPKRATSRRFYEPELVARLRVRGNFYPQQSKALLRPYRYDTVGPAHCTTLSLHAPTRLVVLFTGLACLPTHPPPQYA